MEGMITPERKFAPFGANGRLRSCGRVSYDSRSYADTYGEAVALYHELVTKRRKALEPITEDEYIPAPFIPRRGGWHPMEEPPMDEVDVIWDILMESPAVMPLPVTKTGHGTGPTRTVKLTAWR